MASPRFNGQGFTNPTNPLGLHSENRYRDESPLSNSFMSNEVKMAENKVFNVGAATKTGTKIATKAGAKAAAKAAAKAVAKAAAKASKVAFKAATKGIKAGGKGFGKAASSKAGIRMITVGGIGVTAYYTIAGEFGLGTQFMDNLAGLNCGEKATDAGLEEGTDEYQKSVEKCQESAGQSLKVLGMGAIGLVAAIVILPLLLKKKSKESDE